MVGSTTFLMIFAVFDPLWINYSFNFSKDQAYVHLGLSAQ